MRSIRLALFWQYIFRLGCDPIEIESTLLLQNMMTRLTFQCIDLPASATETMLVKNQHLNVKTNNSYRNNACEKLTYKCIDQQQLQKQFW